MTSITSSVKIGIESLKEDVRIACTSESSTDMADGMKESHKKTVLALELMTTALDTFEQDVLNKIVALESKERSLQNELVAAVARIESSEFLLRNELTAIATREQSVQQRIAAVEAAIESNTPQNERSEQNELTSTESNCAQLSTKRACASKSSADVAEVAIESKEGSLRTAFFVAFVYGSR